MINWILSMEKHKKTILRGIFLVLIVIIQIINKSSLKNIGIEYFNDYYILSICNFYERGIGIIMILYELSNIFSYFKKESVITRFSSIKGIINEITREGFQSFVIIFLITNIPTIILGLGLKIKGNLFMTVMSHTVRQIIFFASISLIFGIIYVLLKGVIYANLITLAIIYIPYGVIISLKNNMFTIFNILSPDRYIDSHEVINRYILIIIIIIITVINTSLLNLFGDLWRFIYRKMDNNITKLFVKSFIGFIIIFVAFNQTLRNIDDYKSIENVFIFIFGYIPYSTNVVEIVSVNIIHVLYVAYIFSDDKGMDIKKLGPYIFTRNYKRSKWVKNILVRKLFEIILYYLFLYGLIFLGAGLYGYRVSSFIDLFTISMVALILSILTTYLIVVIIRFGSMFCDYIYSYAVVIMAVIANLIIVVAGIQNKSEVIKYLPFSQNIISIKDVLYCDRSIDNFSRFIDSYSVEMGVVIIITLIIIFILLSIYRGKNMEIL